MNDEEPMSGREHVLRLFMQHRSSLLAFVLSIVRDFHFAEDVIQEVAVVVCDQWADFRPGSNFQGWARQIARNKVYSLGRKAQRTFSLSPEAIEGLEQAVEADAESNQERLDALQRCLKLLDRKGNEIIALRYQAGMDCQKIARQIHATLPAVHMALCRIRSRLAECVERNAPRMEAL